MHRCDPDTFSAATSSDRIPLHGREAAGPVVVAGGALIVGAFLLAAAGVLRAPPAGAGGVLAATLAALAGAVLALPPARASCSVRRGVLGVLVQLAVVTTASLALPAG